MESPPFDIERAPDGSVVLTAYADDSPEPIRLRLDEETTRMLRDAFDDAVARGTSGGEGAVAEFEADGATVVVIAVPGGSVRVRIER
jgi:hypothetical protein